MTLLKEAQCAGISWWFNQEFLGGASIWKGKVVSLNYSSPPEINFSKFYSFSTFHHFFKLSKTKRQLGNRDGESLELDLSLNCSSAREQCPTYFEPTDVQVPKFVSFWDTMGVWCPIGYSERGGGISSISGDVTQA